MIKLFLSRGYILYGISFISVSCTAVSNQHTIQELLLDMWSQLDLIQAITVTPEQQELFTQALACQALDLYAALALQIPKEDILILHDYQHLCTTLRITSAQVLSSVTTPAKHTLLFVLDMLLNMLIDKLDTLETPGNITDERSPQQISLKDIFTP